MDNQEAFDKMATHLLMQGERAVDVLAGGIVGAGSCMYRTKNSAGKTLMCAVGCLIPDELYCKEFEGNTVRGLLSDRRFEPDHYDEPKYPEIVAVFDGVSEPLLDTMQHIHDDSKTTPADWPRQLAVVAAEYELTQPPILKEALCQTK